MIDEVVDTMGQGIRSLLLSWTANIDQLKKGAEKPDGKSGRL